MSHSLIQVLKNKHPLAQIDALAPKNCIPVLKKMSEIREVMLFPLSHGEFSLKKYWQISRRLKNNKYDEVYILPNSFKSALTPFFARIKKRIGWLGECRYGLLSQTRKLNKKRYPLMVERYVALAFNDDNWDRSHYPKPKLIADKSEAKASIAQYKFDFDDSKPILALCPGAAFGEAKRWPINNFIALGKHYSRLGWNLMVIGGPDEKVFGAKVQKEVGGACLDLTGKLAIDKSIDVLSLASIVVTNDSGLMHIASALNVFQVAIFGSSSTKFTPPLSSNAVIAEVSLPCRPCFKRTCPLGHLDCLNKITPEQIINMIDASFEPAVCAY